LFPPVARRGGERTKTAAQIRPKKLSSASGAGVGRGLGSINCPCAGRMHFARVYYSAPSWPAQVRSADLYFARGRPLLVRTWQQKDGRRVPEDCVELDPDKLQRVSANGTIYRYEGSVSSVG
jgi:hypothetical protein